MPSTLTKQREEEFQNVSLPFGSTTQIAARRAASAQRSRMRAATVNNTTRNAGTINAGIFASQRAANFAAGLKIFPKPDVIPQAIPERQTRRLPLLVRTNRTLRTVLIALCGTAVLGYGLDVAASSDVGRMEEQARRLSEQNTELSAQLLRDISFEGIQKRALGHCGLKVPDTVLNIPSVTAPAMHAFKPFKHHLPIMSGY